jgi:hypothetical protein
VYASTRGIHPGPERDYEVDALKAGTAISTHRPKHYPGSPNMTYQWAIAKGQL